MVGSTVYCVIISWWERKVQVPYLASMIPKKGVSHTCWIGMGIPAPYMASKNTMSRVVSLLMDNGENADSPCGCGWCHCSRKVVARGPVTAVCQSRLLMRSPLTPWDTGVLLLPYGGGKKKIPSFLLSLQ